MKLSILETNKEEEEIKFYLIKISNNDIQVNVLFPNGTSTTLGWFREEEGKIFFELMFVSSDNDNFYKYFHVGEDDFDKEHEMEVIY